MMQVLRRNWWFVTLIVLLGSWGALVWTPPAGAFPTYTCDPSVGNCSPASATSGSLTSNCAQCHGDFNQGRYTSLTDGQDYGDTLMNMHKDMLSNDCNTCHGSGGNWPVRLNASSGGSGFDPISCSGCHGRAQDRNPGGCNDSTHATGFCSVTRSTSCNTGADCPAGETCVLPCGDGAGLRQQHYNANRTISTANGPLSTRACADCHSDANPANFTPAGENVLPPYYALPDAAHPDKPTDPCNPAPGYVEKMKGGNPPVPLGSLDGLNNDGDRDAIGPLYDQFDPDCQPDPCAGVNCDDGNACTADSCDGSSGACVHAPIAPPLEAGPVDLQDEVTIVWGPGANATQWNSYRGTIPANGLGSRPPGGAYDHACHESADAAGDGAMLSTDLSTPPIGSGYYYMATGENVCVEGPLGTDSSGAARPNTAPCPTPP